MGSLRFSKPASPQVHRPGIIVKAPSGQAALLIWFRLGMAFLPPIGLLVPPFGKGVWLLGSGYLMVMPPHLVEGANDCPIKKNSDNPHEQRLSVKLSCQVLFLVPAVAFSLSRRDENVDGSRHGCQRP